MINPNKFCHKACFWIDQNLPKADGKHILITGANTGIGYALSWALGYLNAKRITMGCRNLQKGKAAQKTLQKCFPNTAFNVIKLDLSCMSTIEQATTQLPIDPIDALVHNAGIALHSTDEILNQDGLCQTFFTNHLAPFYLTARLWPYFNFQTTMTIVCMSSLAYLRGSDKYFQDYTEPQAKKDFFTQAPYHSIYADSKLANLYFAYNLQQKAQEYHIPLTATACHPGLVWTQINENHTHTTLLEAIAEKNWNALALRLAYLTRLYQKDTLWAALPALYALLKPQASSKVIGPGSLFGLYGPPKEYRFHQTRTTHTQVQKLWHLSERTLQLSYSPLFNNMKHLKSIAQHH